MGADRDYCQGLFDKELGKVEIMELSAGTWVTAHLASGNQPAVVTRGNVDGSASLTIFAVGEVLFRDNVKRYVYEEGDEESDKVGYFS